MLLPLTLDLPAVDDLLSVVTIGRGPDGGVECRFQRVADTPRPLSASKTADLLRWLADAIELDAL